MTGRIGSQPVILKIWLLLGSGNPQIECGPGPIPILGWLALSSIKVFLCGH
jgi:hypothetical protein